MDFFVFAHSFLLSIHYPQNYILYVLIILNITSIKWNVHYWNPDVTPGGIYNVPIQIVPSVNPLTLRKGDTYRIRVYKNGQPYANAPLIKDVINDLTNESTADKDGYATVTVSANGLNVVGVEVAGDKEDEHTTQKYFSSLSFIIDPE